MKGELWGSRVRWILFSYTDSVLVDNPESTAQRFLHQDRDCAGNCFQNMGFVLMHQSEDDDPRIILWRVRLNAGKIEVQSKQGPLFYTAHFCQIGVGRTPHRLVKDGHDVMTSFT